MQSLSRPTFIGLGAIAIWATLALFTAMTGKMPPFLTTAICFVLAGSSSSVRLSGGVTGRS